MRGFSVCAAIAVSMGLATSALATPLKMEYCVTPVGGLFEYKITLTLDNNDGSWASGQGWGWIMFGDIPGPAASPLNDFVMNPASFPIGPYTELTSAGGAHNGPTLGPIWTPPGPPTTFVMNLWVPNAIGDKLEWTGTSASNLAQGQMLWSNLWFGGGATIAEFIVGDLVCENPCYPDCNGVGGLTIADFGCFQTAFVAGNPYADCNGVGGLTIADFGCFQTAFVAGCP
jgi:hypothetical protein